MTCPGCSSEKSREVTLRGVRVHRCSSCGAIFGTVYLGDSYSIVSPYFSKGPEPDASETRYFDLTTLGSTIGRRHGWFIPETGRLIQVG